MERDTINYITFAVIFINQNRIIMFYDQSRLPNRRSIRLKGYDYSQPGIYFITICTYHRMHLFGKIHNGEMSLDARGRIAWNEWMITPDLRPNIGLDAFVVMPNHIHGIIIVGADCIRPHENHPITHTPDESMQSDPTIGAIVRGYKSTVTKQINNFWNTIGHPVWQRNYYEHIIRNEYEYQNIANYIRNNPACWNNDCFC